MAENTRASRLAIRKETTENTLIALSAGTQFIPLQPGFEFSPNVETIENEEIRSSIGRAAPIQGIEQPTGSFSEYLKGSGTQGTAPNWGDLLEACFGSVASNGTERTTTVGSSISAIVLGAGGSDFSRGSAILIKDGTNGYSIRAIDSVSTNTLTPAFDLSVSAPATGISVGKNVKYTPADSGHPTLSAWLFRGNGGALEAISGCRVTELSMEMEVGQLINISFNIEGGGYYFNPLMVTSSNNKIALTTDNVTDSEVTIPARTYKNPHDLADAIAAALNAADPLETFTCVYSNSTGKFTIATSTSSVLSLLWKTGLSGSDNDDDHIGTLLGFSDAADDTGATTYTSDNAITLTSALTPSYDSADPMVAKNMEMLVGGSASSFQAICAQSFQLRISNEKQLVRCINAESGVSGSILRERQVEIQVVAVLSRYDADVFDKFINNEDVKMQFSFGTKSGGNWVAGKCGCVYVPTAKISAFQLGDDNGIVTMQYTIRPYVNSSGQPEVYLNFL